MSNDNDIKEQSEKVSIEDEKVNNDVQSVNAEETKEVKKELKTEESQEENQEENLEENQKENHKNKINSYAHKDSSKESYTQDEQDKSTFSGETDHNGILNVKSNDKNNNKLSSYFKNTNGEKFSKNWMTFYLVTLIVILFIELFVTVQSKNNYIVFGGLLVVIAIFSYLAIDEFVKLARVAKEHEMNKLDLHIKSQKAIYSVINKKMDQVNTRISHLDHEISHNNDNYNNIMKGVAKVIITKNHEFSNNIINELKTSKDVDTEKVDNSIDLSEVINKIQEFENNINDNINNNLNNSKSESDKRNEYLEQIIKLLENNSNDIKDAITKIEESTKVKTRKKVEKKVEKKVDKKVDKKEDKIEDKKQDIDVDLDLGLVVEADSKESNKNEELDVTSDVVENGITDNSNNMNNTEDIDENKSAEDILGLGNNDNKQDIKVDMPEDIDLSDPNKQLSPEEISALFASIQ